MSAAVFLKLLAIFAVVGIGWGVARKGLLGQGDASKVVAGLAFNVFVPALLFRTAARTDFGRLDGQFLLAFFAPTLTVMTVVYLTQRFLLRLPSEGDGRGEGGRARSAANPATRACTGSYGNAVQVGIPLAAALFGEAGLALHITLVSLHGLVLLTILTALAETDLARARLKSDGGRARLGPMLAMTVRNTVIHPVILPVLVGLAWNLAGLPIPALMDEILLTLGQGVVPVCLVLIGISLAHYGIRGALGGAFAIAAVKLLLQPLAVLLFARGVIGLHGVPLAIVVVMAGLPVGSNALIFAQRYDTLQAESSTAIVVSTLAFMATLPLWLAVLHALG